MINLKQGEYTVTHLLPEITWLYDGINDSIYIDESETAAFVIDTGMADGSLLKEIRKVTAKPVTLVVTHGHLDHVMKAAEFENFYMSKQDDYLVPAEAGVDFNKRIHLKDGDIIQIPGLKLIAVSLPGHTRGSMLFVDQTHKVVFNGDAFCNGRNCWMQLPGCLPLSEYAENVLKAIDRLKALGVDENWEFLSGHYEQRWACRIEDKEENKPDLQMMEDTIILCRKLVSGKIRGAVEKDDPSMGEQAYNAHYGKAEILYCLSQL